MNTLNMRFQESLTNRFLERQKVIARRRIRKMVLRYLQRKNPSQKARHTNTLKL